MEHAFETNGLTKRFGSVTALDRIDLHVRCPSIVGLLGKNGSGKTTLIQHLMGLELPDEGSVTTLDRPSARLEHEELIHIGYVPQEIRLLDWMTVEQHVRYVACFYPSWDRKREQRLLEELELDTSKVVGTLSTGSRQKLAIILAVCHHPNLLVLDEPVSDLDPIVRGKLLEFLLELLREDRATILVSSHVLRDVEKIVDWVICLDEGHVVTDAGLDELKELYAEWRVVANNGELPARFTEPFVLSQEISGRQARLLVRQDASDLEAFRATHGVEVTGRPLNLEEMFPVLVGEQGVMTAVRPFFLLLGRASVFWLGAFALLCGSLIVVGVADPDSRMDHYLDATFIACVWFPAAAGWLVGLVIQDFQHTSFAYQLPGVRPRIAVGYVGTGFAVSAVVAAVIAQTSSTHHSLLLLFALALGAYCLGGTLQDPLSSWMTFTNTLLAVFVFVMSRDLARIAGEHPWIAAAVSLGIGAAGLGRLFARSTFRRKPFRLTKPLPGRFSLEKSQKYESRRRLGDRSRTTRWRAGYIGSNSWAWVRAALYETHGAMGWKTFSKAIGRLWPLGLLVVIYAWADKGDMPFGEAVGRSLYDALFRSPHEAPFGEKGGAYLMVLIVIAAAGIVTALFKAVALSDALFYPLSRLQRAQVAFRSGLVDVALLLVILGLGLFVIGHLTGLLVGYEARFDFMPFYFRVLMVTLVLMPLGHLGRLRLRAASRRRAENTIVGVAFGVVGFVVAVGVCVFISPLIFVSPMLELSTLVVALLISQLTYRRGLRSYYRTADLA